MHKLFVTIFLLSFAACSTRSVDPTQYVNPFIGSSGGGNTFPGATVPWGMVSVSPHTVNDAPSGYIHGEPWFYGFGHLHLSGTGCADLGSVIITAGRGKVKTTPEKYHCSYQDETADPGFYSVQLIEPKVYAETTATKRCGIIRFTPTDTGTVNILIDAGRSLVERQGGNVRFVSPIEIEGYNISGGLCGEDNRHKIYFVSRISLTPALYGTWTGEEITMDHEAMFPDVAVGAWMTFESAKRQPISIKTGISYVSIANARENLNAEIPGWSFNKIRRNASSEWQKQLSKIKVSGNDKSDLMKFYTALYHCLIHPNIISDVNGEYPKMGRAGVGRYNDRERYSVFSLWDTYRTVHPLLTLVYPEQQTAMIQTMLDMYLENGYLPKWELAGNETYMMVGDPAAIVIADTYVKGLTDFDEETALDAVLKPVLLQPGEVAPPVRAGYQELLEYGYIPFEQDTNEAWWVWGPVSTTLEYSLSDFSIGRLAERLGNVDLAGMFFQRASSYRNLFDNNTDFIRPKLKNGSWKEPFDPLETEGSGTWIGSGGPGYVEGNAWNYTWFVPHDIPGLINQFGGSAPFTQKLERCFRDGHFTINNEPDIAYPYLFTYVPNHEYRTAELVSDIMMNDFGTGADGLPGNDDAGAISAWFVFSALGFYPACTAVDDYRIGVPVFKKITIHLDENSYPGRQIVIERTGELADDKRLQSLLIDGESSLGYQLSHKRLVQGATIKFIISGK